MAWEGAREFRTRRRRRAEGNLSHQWGNNKRKLSRNFLDRNTKTEIDFVVHVAYKLLDSQSDDIDDASVCLQKRPAAVFDRKIRFMTPTSLFAASGYRFS